MLTPCPALDFVDALHVLVEALFGDQPLAHVAHKPRPLQLPALAPQQMAFLHPVFADGAINADRLVGVEMPSRCVATLAVGAFELNEKCCT